VDEVSPVYRSPKVIKEKKVRSIGRNGGQEAILQTQILLKRKLSANFIEKKIG